MSISDTMVAKMLLLNVMANLNVVHRKFLDDKSSESQKRKVTIIQMQKNSSSLSSHISPSPRPFIVNTNPKFFAVSQISFWQVGHEVCCVSCLLD